MSIDPRLIERRRVVAEDKAKRNVTRLLKFLASVVVVASVVWLFFSPWLIVGEVETTGVSVSNTNSILADLGVVAGTPMIRIRAAATEQALLKDSWVADADVRVRWPNRVLVAVTERTPVAWALTAAGWSRRAVDGVALPSPSRPDDDMARVELPDLSEDSATSSKELLGALEFVSALPTRRHVGTVVTIEDGELWATVAGYQVRLGRPVEMGEKALSLNALLDQNVPEGSLLVLVAPTNPSYLAPSADETDAGTTDTGED
jgi:cell division protein FtsQ